MKANGTRVRWRMSQCVDQDTSDLRSEIFILRFVKFPVLPQALYITRPHVEVIATTEFDQLSNPGVFVFVAEPSGRTDFDS